jgi:tetrahydromethanopterin S-methyltransferase subunit F
MCTCGCGSSNDSDSDSIDTVVCNINYRAHIFTSVCSSSSDSNATE